MFLLVKISSSSSLSAAATAAPEEIPARMPSSSIRRRAVEMASSLVMATTLSISFRSRLPRNKASPDTLGFCADWFDLFACQRLSDNRRVGWLNGNGNQIFFTFRAFNIARHPGQRTAGAYAGDKHINLTVGIFPDFRAGGFLMNFRVGRVAELLEQQIFCRIAGDDFFGLLNRALHAFRAFGQDRGSHPALSAAYDAQCSWFQA